MPTDLAAAERHIVVSIQSSTFLAFECNERRAAATALADRIYLSIGGKQPVTASVLSARITRLPSQETVQVEDSHPRCLFNRPPIVEISALLRAIAEASFQPLTSGALIAIKRRKL
jgi:hypothetical protein